MKPILRRNCFSMSKSFSTMEDISFGFKGNWVRSNSWTQSTFNSWPYFNERGRCLSRSKWWPGSRSSR